MGLLWNFVLRLKICCRTGKYNPEICVPNAVHKGPVPVDGLSDIFKSAFLGQNAY